MRVIRVLCRLKHFPHCNGMVSHQSENTHVLQDAFLSKMLSPLTAKEWFLMCEFLDAN